MEDRRYLCIDLKSFYASVECVERGLDPMTAHLAVADPERGKGTICLAISPAMKAMGIKNRCRVYQIPKDMQYIMAQPRMKLYMEYSAEIYAVYLKYLAKEDIHVYSIDEAFLDVTQYLALYHLSVRQLAERMMADIRKTTGIPAAAGAGTNLYLAKVALDIMAKRRKDNIGFLNEELYRKILWNHRPLTDFWRVGEKTAKRLARLGIQTMGEIAGAKEELLYNMFGVDAELLIDHAWGKESVTMADIKAYKPKTSSLSSSQALFRDYTYEECRLLVKEMTDSLCLDLADRGLAAQTFVVAIEYSYKAEIPPSSGTISMPAAANNYRVVLPYILKLYERITRKHTPIRKLTMTCKGLTEETYQQYDLFTDYAMLERERSLQGAILEIKRRYGRNAVVRGMDLLKEGTAIERNRQIGGHKSGE